MRPIARSLLMTYAALALVAALVACSSSTTGKPDVATRQLEERIQRGISPQIGTSYSVSCPSRHPTTVGTRFQCYARFTGHRPRDLIGSPDYWVDVRVNGSAGGLAWQVEPHG